MKRRGVKVAEAQEMMVSIVFEISKGSCNKHNMTQKGNDKI